MGPSVHFVLHSSGLHLDKEKGLADISWPPLTNILGVPDVRIKVRVRIPVLNISHVSTVIY